MKHLFQTILAGFILTSLASHAQLPWERQGAQGRPASAPAPAPPRPSDHDGAPPMPNHPPPIVVGDMFQFVEGAWAEYEILDKSENTTFILRMAILGQVDARTSTFGRRQPHRWLEIDVQMPDQPRVVINYLALETPQGPGDPNEMIIQIEGFRDPIRFGRAWLRGNKDEIVDADYEWVRQEVDEEVIIHGNRSFTAWRVQAQAEDGTTVEAVVSEDLPPFGLYFAETTDQRMTLRDWGLGAGSTITGEPIGLTRWISRQIREGMQEQ